MSESEAVTILKAIQKQVESYNDLRYVKSWTRFKYELDLVNKGVFPWVNFHVVNLIIKEADNMRQYDVLRDQYLIVITYASRDTEKDAVIEGTKLVKGAWQIFDDIKAAIQQDTTFNGAVNDNPFKSNVNTDAITFDEGKHWVGRGSTSFSVYKDINQR